MALLAEDGTVVELGGDELAAGMVSLVLGDGFCSLGEARDGVGRAREWTGLEGQGCGRGGGSKKGAYQGASDVAAIRGGGRHWG